MYSLYSIIKCTETQRTSWAGYTTSLYHVILLTSAQQHGGQTPNRPNDLMGHIPRRISQRKSRRDNRGRIKKCVLFYWCMLHTRDRFNGGKSAVLKKIKFVNFLLKTCRIGPYSQNPWHKLKALNQCEVVSDGKERQHLFNNQSNSSHGNRLKDDLTIRYFALSVPGLASGHAHLR